MRGLWILLILAASPIFADGERSDDFDYYVLSLSWSPNFCVRDADADHPQCAPGRALGFSLHGLWPQYEDGWPSYCPTAKRAPSRTMTSDEADIYGSSGLAWHQWKKHGTCSGLSAEAYYDLARKAYDNVNRPEIFRKLEQMYELPATVVEDAFLESNPGLEADQVTVTCKGQTIQEVRFCLTKDLDLRQCGLDVIRDCSLDDAIIYPISQN